MSIQVSKRVWEGSKHKSGNLLLLLAIADHADEEGKAYPGIPLLADKMRVTPRHVHRCISEALTSGELGILPEAAPGGGPWYQIQLHALTRVTRSLTSPRWPPASGGRDGDSSPEDAGDHRYIREPSVKSSNQPSMKPSSHQTSKFIPLERHSEHQKKMTAVRLVSLPKNGF
jgi:hypothetical protein